MILGFVITNQMLWEEKVKASSTNSKWTCDVFNSTPVPPTVASRMERQGSRWPAADDGRRQMMFSVINIIKHYYV